MDSFINSVRTHALTTYVQNFCDVDNETEHMHSCSQEAWMTESSILFWNAWGRGKPSRGRVLGTLGVEGIFIVTAHPLDHEALTLAPSGV